MATFSRTGVSVFWCSLENEQSTFPAIDWWMPAVATDLPIARCDAQRNTAALPIEPMFAKLADELARASALYAPNWDGFRAIV
jgi:hypothetical protein